MLLRSSYADGADVRQRAEPLARQRCFPGLEPDHRLQMTDIGTGLGVSPN